MVGSLLLRSLARSERIYQAMVERGYQGQIRMLNPARPQAQDILFCLPVVGLFIAIATVLSMDPQILVLDEPSAGLDPRARRNLIRLLQRLDTTMLISTHDMLLIAELLPRTAVMQDGCIVADGSTEAILDDTALLERYGLEGV